MIVRYYDGLCELLLKIEGGQGFLRDFRQNCSDHFNVQSEMKKTDDVLMRCTKNKSNMKISEMIPVQIQMVKKAKFFKSSPL